MSDYIYVSDADRIKAKDKRIEELQAELEAADDLHNRDAESYERLTAALESIAANTCCERCQEAALVAREALAAVEGKDDG